MKPELISECVAACLAQFGERRYGSALLSLLPALESTAKLRFPSTKGAGERVKRFLEEQEDIISAISVNMFMQGSHYAGRTFPEAIYTMVEAPLLHGGQLDPKLKFVEVGGLSIGAEEWVLPVQYILGLCVGVLVAPENRYRQQLKEDVVLRVLGQARLFSVNHMWGAQDLLRQQIRNHFDMEG